MVTCYRHGGYHLDGSELGVIIMCSGVLQIFWQVGNIIIIEEHSSAEPLNNGHVGRTRHFFIRTEVFLSLEVKMY